MKETIKELREISNEVLYVQFDALNDRLRAICDNVIKINDLKLCTDLKNSIVDFFEKVYYSNRKIDIVKAMLSIQSLLEKYETILNNY